MRDGPAEPWIDTPRAAVAGQLHGGLPEPFGTRSRMIHVSDREDIPPNLDRAAQALSIDCQRVALADIGDVMIGDMMWVSLSQDPGAAVLAVLQQQHRDFCVPLVLDLAGSAIDPAWGLFGDSDGVTIVIDPDEGDCLAAMGQVLRSGSGRLNSPVIEMRERRLEQLQEEVQRIGRVLARLSAEDGGGMGAADGAREPASPFIENHMHSPIRGFSTGGMDSANGLPTVSPRDVRRVIRYRRMREEFFGGDIFADPAWDMLLDLYAARLERHRVSVSSLCIAAAVPATTALRWIKTLTETGVFERSADPHDGRRIFVILSERSTQAMSRYFAGLDGDGVPI